VRVRKVAAVFSARRVGNFYRAVMFDTFVTHARDDAAEAHNCNIA
jgi:hypothetical protein